MVFVILVQCFLYLLSFLLEVWFQWKSHLVQTESYSFNNAVCPVSICCFSLWWGGLKVSSSTFSNVIFSVVMLCVVSASGLSLRYFFHGWFQMAYIFSFVESDMFIGVIWYQNIHRCFSFDVAYAIYDVDIWILSFCWILISDKICHMSFNCMSFDFDWDDPIMSRRYFESWHDNSYFCSSVHRFYCKWQIYCLFYVKVLFLIPGIWQGTFSSGYQFQIVSLCLVACCI